jgi:hypothetical protein
VRSRPPGERIPLISERVASNLDRISRVLTGEVVAKLEQWLKMIRAMLTGCPARIVEGRDLIVDHATGILQRPGPT